MPLKNWAPASLRLPALNVVEQANVTLKDAAESQPARAGAANRRADSLLPLVFPARRPSASTLPLIHSSGANVPRSEFPFAKLRFCLVRGPAHALTGPHRPWPL